jgi:hypothetical protein
MVEVFIDEVEQAYANFRDKLSKFKEYIKHLESIPENKRTIKEKELVEKFGVNQKKPK